MMYAGWSQHLRPFSVSKSMVTVSTIVVTVSRCTASYMVIVTPIWQKLSSVEHKKLLIVRNFWQLFSQIIGETLLIVTHIWRNRTSFHEYVSS
jgi:hypothetical protein